MSHQIFNFDHEPTVSVPARAPRRCTVALVVALIAGLLLSSRPLAAQATAPARPIGTGVIVRLNTVLELPVVNFLLGTTSDLLDSSTNLYLLQSKTGATVDNLLQLALDLVPLHILASAEPNEPVQFNDANLNESSMSVLNQSSMSVLDQSSMSVLDGQTQGYYGSQVNSAYVTQSAIAQIEASVAANRHSTGAGIVVADIDNGSDPLNQVLLPTYTTGWNFLDNTPDWSCWSDQSSLGLLLSGGLSVLNPNDSANSSNVNESSMSVLNGDTVSVLNQSSMSVLDGGNVAVVNGQIVASPGYMLFLEMYSQHPEFAHGNAVLGLVHLVAPEAHLMPIKAFTPDGEGDLASILSSIYYAVHMKANVINMSFSSPTNSPQLQAALNYAWQQGVVLVASAGNNASAETLYPGSYPNVMNTAALDPSNNLASFSDYGVNVQVAAPGVGLITPFPDNLWGVVSGTSFSAPLVTGEAALLLSRNNGNGSVTETVEGTANGAIPASAQGVGNGVIQVAAALAALGLQP